MLGFHNLHPAYEATVNDENIVLVLRAWVGAQVPSLLHFRVAMETAGMQTVYSKAVWLHYPQGNLCLHRTRVPCNATSPGRGRLCRKNMPDKEYTREKRERNGKERGEERREGWERRGEGRGGEGGKGRKSVSLRILY